VQLDTAKKTLKRVLLGSMVWVWWQCNCWNNDLRVNYNLWSAANSKFYQKQNFLSYRVCIFAQLHSPNVDDRSSRIDTSAACWCIKVSDGSLFSVVLHYFRDTLFHLFM